MHYLNKKTLSLLSLLIIPGILSMPLFMHTSLLILPIAMCSIGGMAFGTLISKK